MEKMILTFIYPSGVNLGFNQSDVWRQSLPLFFVCVFTPPLPVHIWHIVVIETHVHCDLHLPHAFVVYHMRINDPFICVVTHTSSDSCTRFIATSLPLRVFHTHLFPYYIVLS